MKTASDVAFSDSVKAVQRERGSRAAYARVEWPDAIDGDLRAFLAQQTSFYLATASAEGQPYIQHRGGPAGFVRVLDDKTLAFADYRGNRQYISTGNLAENGRVHLFFMDYARRRRIKVWGTARVSDDAELVRSLMPADYRAKAEQAIVVTVAAWDVNCPQHIPQKLDADDVRAALAERDGKIAALAAELEALKAQRR